MHLVKTLVDLGAVKESVDVEEGNFHHPKAEDEGAQRPPGAWKGHSRPQGCEGCDADGQRQGDKELRGRIGQTD